MVVIVFIAIVCFISNVNTTSYARATHFAKEDLEIAVHDATLQLDDSYLSEGKIVFDQDKAKQVFSESLEKNTGMTDSDYIILDFKFYDDSNSTFPVFYQSSNTQFTDTFLYPTILVIIETNSTKFFLGSKKYEIKQLASYSYKRSK